METSLKIVTHIVFSITNCLMVVIVYMHIIRMLSFGLMILQGWKWMRVLLRIYNIY